MSRKKIAVYPDAEQALSDCSEAYRDRVKNCAIEMADRMGRTTVTPDDVKNADYQLQHNLYSNHSFGRKKLVTSFAIYIFGAILSQGFSTLSTPLGALLFLFGAVGGATAFLFARD